MAEQNNSRTSSVRSGYDAAAAGYEARFDRNPRNAARFARIEACQLSLARQADRVLVLGCGTGRLQRQLTSPDCVGLDLSRAMLGHARQRGLAVVQGDAHALPFATDSFDLVCATNAVFRYLDYPRAFDECARVVRSGGHLAVHQYAARTWSIGHLVGRGAAPEPRHVGHPDELRGPARVAGFDQVALYLWRSVRFPPYALPIPPGLPGRWWRHMTLILRRR